MSGGLGFDIKVKSPNLIIKDKRYLTEDTNFGPPSIGTNNHSRQIYNNK